MTKEEALKKKETFKEKIRERLLAPDVRLFDFFNIDNDDWLATPSMNETTIKIWNDLKDMCVKQENTSAHVDVGEVLRVIGDEIIIALGTSPLNEDNRLPSEIAEDELCSVTAAKIYRHLINIKMVWFIACDYNGTQYNLPYVNKLIEKDVGTRLLNMAIFNSVRSLAIKNIGRMRLADILK